MEIKLVKASKKKRRSRKGGPRYWVLAMGTMGMIVAFTVGNSRAMNVGYAAEKNGRLEITRSIEDEAFKPYDFSIPAGRLGDALDAFKKVTGIAFKVDKPDMLDIGSAGVTGTFTAEQALQKILEGTGIGYSFTDPRNVSIVLRAQAATVDVADSGERVISSLKQTAALRDIPQSVSVISKDTIEKQGATTLRDVLNNVPGITITAGEGGAPAGDNLTIRGFSARNDIYVDGVRDLGPQSRDPFNLEQVEVVKGPSSSFTGRGSTGGTINLVSKLPNLRRSIGGSFTAGSDKTKRGTIDINTPLSDSIAFRLNAMAHDSDFPGRDAVSNTRWGLAPSIVFGLGSPQRFSASYFYIQQNNVSDYGIPWVPVTNNALVAYRDKPAPVPRDTFYGFIDRDREKLRSDLVTLRYEYDFNDNLQARNQFRYGYSRRDSIATPPRFNSNNTTVINREMRSWITNDDIVDNQTDFLGKFNTGDIKHSVVFGTSVSYERNQRVLRTAANSLTTLLDPNPRDVYTGAIITSPYEGDVTGKTYAGYLFDTINFNKYVDFVGGLRYDYFSVGGVAAATTGLSDLRRVDRIWSGRAALIVKPTENGSIYVSYGTSANPSLEGLSYSVANTAIDPEKTFTTELGVKWDFFRRRLLLSSAVFRVDKTNARTAGVNPGDPPQVLDGEQRVQGVEFSATGSISRNWQIFAGYTFLDSEILKTNTLPTVVNGVPFYELGKELINTPRNSFNLWTTYTLGKFYFGGGPRFVDKRYGNNINTRWVDSYWLVDLLASYQLTKNIDVRVNLNNLTDKYYIDRIGGGHIVPGAGRVVLVSTGFRF
jgi:catecholate siderophore receptor